MIIRTFRESMRLGGWWLLVEGFEKGAYRRFNIKDEGKFATAIGDDFAMMRQVIHRRFSRAKKEEDGHQSSNWPDLILIDGGLGRISGA